MHTSAWIVTTLHYLASGVSTRKWKGGAVTGREVSLDNYVDNNMQQTLRNFYKV